MAKLLDHRESHVTTAVRGTVGHIAPEYLSTGQSSEKTDVFGFGILLLELITGQKALDFGRTANQKGVMLDWVSTCSHFITMFKQNLQPSFPALKAFKIPSTQHIIKLECEYAGEETPSRGQVEYDG